MMIVGNYGRGGHIVTGGCLRRSSSGVMGRKLLLLMMMRKGGSAGCGAWGELAAIAEERGGRLRRHVALEVRVESRVMVVGIGRLLVEL